MYKGIRYGDIYCLFIRNKPKIEIELSQNAITLADYVIGDYENNNNRIVSFQ